MAAVRSENFLTPIMRLVQGNPLTPQTKDLTTGAPLTVKQGPNIGQPTQKYFIAVAGRKGDPEVEALRAQYEAIARAVFPQFFPNGGPCTNPNFSWKIVDGDGFDQDGKPNNVKEGFAGHWIFRFASSFAPKCYQRGKYGPGEQLVLLPGQPDPIPRGHYVRVSGTVSDNTGSNKAGLYANLGMVEWNAVGELITSGPDAAVVFGGAPGAAPAPAPAPAGYAPPPPPAAAPMFTMTAAAGAFTREQYHASGHTDESLIAQGFMVRNAPPAAAPAPPPPAPAPAPAPAPVAVAPHPGILAPLAHNGSAPPPPPPAQIAAAAPGYKMTNPAGATYAQYRADPGWTDALLIQNGLMVPV